MGYWLKLYTDVLDDPKYFRLSEEAKLGMYELMLVAKKIENGELTGKLPTIDDIAFHTRKCREHWEKILPELESIGFVTNENELPIIKNYTKRQGAIPDDVRAKQFRKKRNDAAMNSITIASQNSHDIVTNRDGETETDKKQIRKETDVEAEAEKSENEEFAAAAVDPNFKKWSDVFTEKTGITSCPDDFKSLAKQATINNMVTALKEMSLKHMVVSKPSGIVTPTIMVASRNRNQVTDFRNYDEED